MSSFLTQILCGTGLVLVQFVAAVPWLAVLDPKASRNLARRPQNWLIGMVAIIVLGALMGLAVSVIIQDPNRLLNWGKIYGALLQAQLIIDLFVLIFPLLTLVWPRGAAVALAAFREGVRQPMFWLIAAIFIGLMACSPFIPYFTFGEDHKMVRELGYNMIPLAAVLFGVLAASMSISEEIEGRTAITVMSKPVSRRQFLLGKFFGTLLASSFMIGLLGWFFNGVMWFTYVFLREEITPPPWLEPARLAWSATLGEANLNFILGAGVWFDNTLAMLPGLIFGACQAMVLLAVAVALATRLPMIVNFVTCVAVFFLGHLAHILVYVSANRFALVNFMAKFFNAVLPGLEYFDLGPLLARDIAPDPRQFGIYIGSVVAYAILYSIIALLFGLILFEDRDLA